MKNIIKLTSVFLLIFLWGQIVYAEKTRLLLAFQYNESAPYQIGYGEKIADPPGVALDIIKKAVEDLNVDLKFIRYPNKRVIYSVGSGIVDGAFIFSYKTSRLPMVVYPTKENGELDTDKRIAILAYNFYKMKGSDLGWNGKKLTNAHGSPVGSDLGNSITDDLKKLGINVETAQSVKENLLKLQHGRIVAYASQPEQADFYIQETGIPVVKLQTPIKSKPYFLILSHQFVEKHPNLAKAIWNNISKVREKVTKDVIKKYVK